MQRLPAYLGHHRSGSTWIFRVLREIVEDILGERLLHAPDETAFGGDLAAAWRSGAFDLLCYTNASYSKLAGVPLRAVHVVRDPRDLLVSAYFAHLRSHPTAGWPALAEFRGLLETVSEEAGMTLELDFLAHVFEAMAGFPVAAEGVFELRYEELIEAPAAGLARIFAELGLDRRVDAKLLRGVVERHDFASLSGGRERGQTDPSHHYRSGRSGDWKRHFTPALAAAFESRHGALLRRYRYESSSEWAKSPGVAVG